MNRERDGFEVGDRVRVRKSTSSARTGDTVWTVTGLADDGRTVVMQRTAYGKTHTARVRAAMLWLVQTVEERMAEELMCKPEPPGKGSPYPAGFKTWPKAGEKIRLLTDKDREGFETKFTVRKSKSGSSVSI